MLPFLNNKKSSIAGSIIEKRKPDGGLAQVEPEESNDEGLEACAQDILSAVEAKDLKALVSSLKSFFEICDSTPHKEGDPIENSEEN